MLPHEVAACDEHGKVRPRKFWVNRPLADDSFGTGWVLFFLLCHIFHFFYNGERNMNSDITRRSGRIILMLAASPCRSVSGGSRGRSDLFKNCLRDESQAWFLWPRTHKKENDLQREQRETESRAKESTFFGKAMSYPRAAPSPSKQSV
jgi:hypothetical protein